MDRVSDWLVRIGAAGLIAMVGVISWQVFGRFVLNSSPSWTEQAAMILMIWYVFFAAAAGVWERFHIRIEILEQWLSARSRRNLRVAIHALVAGFGLVLLVYGAQLAWLVRDFVVPSLGISRGIAYLPIPLAGLLTIVFSIARIRVRLKEQV
jgi:TRAP-type C4-dicarboxylate transport system permease small subunit